MGIFGILTLLDMFDVKNNKKHRYYAMHGMIMLHDK